MPLKNDWANGDLFTPAAANDMANVVNAFGLDRVVSTRVVTGTGIDLTGTTNSSTAFQTILTAAAADAAAASGIVEVHIPPGILLLTTGVTVGAGVTLRGAGLGATKIRSAYAPGSGLGILQLNGASDITIADLTVEATAGEWNASTNSPTLANGTGTAGQSYIVSVAGTALGITFAVGDYVFYTGSVWQKGNNSIGMSGGYNGLQSRVTITNCRITGTTNNAVRFPYAVKDLTFSNNTLDDCDAGFVSYAPTVASGLISSGWIISNNRFRDVGSVNIGLYGGTNALTISTVRGVEISGNDLRDFKQTAGDGPIPIEPTCVTNIVIANNVIDGTATNGISTGCNVNMTITGNTIRNQSNYAIELNGGKQITIVGNVVENCRTFANDTAVPAITVPLSDILIADNVYVGSGLSNAQSVDAINFQSARRVRITNNIFSDWQYLRSAIRLGNSSATYVVYDSVVEGNTFIATDANTKVFAVNVNTAVRCSVRHNTFRVNRATVAGDEYTSVITIAQDANSSETLIDGNHIIFSGSMAATTGVSGISNGNAGAAACAKLTICNNIVRNGNLGLRPVTNSTDLVVYGNDTFTCGAADSIPATAKANGTRLASLLDTNGKTAIAFGATSSAVNHLKVTNSATGNQITAEAAGSDTNINFMIAPKGTGIVTIHDGPGNWLARFRSVTSAVNYWQIFSSAAGTAISATAAGADSNISINLVPKGTGTLQANGVAVSTNSITATHTAQQIELGHDTDTTVSRTSAGQIAVEGNPVGIKVAVPATAGATGVVGQWAADSSWFYVCTASNTWVRAALATW